MSICSHKAIEMAYNGQFYYPVCVDCKIPIAATSNTGNYLLRTKATWDCDNKDKAAGDE